MRYSLLVLIVLLPCWGRKPHSTPLPAGEYTSIAPDIVRTLEYETPEFRVSAHRFDERSRFRVVVERPDNSLHYCMSDPAFESALGELEALKIRRVLGEGERAKLKKDRPFHRLRYASQPPLDAYDEVLSPLSSGALTVESEGFTYELTLSTHTVERLGRACR